MSLCGTLLTFEAHAGNKECMSVIYSYIAYIAQISYSKVHDHEDWSNVGFEPMNLFLSSTY